MPVIMKCPVCYYQTIFKNYVYCPRCGNGLCKNIIRRKSDKRFEVFVTRKEIFDDDKGRY